jgi:hypothetical protein
MEQSLRWAHGISKKLCASEIFIRMGISTVEQIRRSNPRKSELQVAVNIWCRLHVFHTIRSLRDVMKIWCGDFKLMDCVETVLAALTKQPVIFFLRRLSFVAVRLTGRPGFDSGKLFWIWRKSEMVLTSGTLRTGTEAWDAGTVLLRFFWARSQSYEKWILASSMSVCSPAWNNSTPTGRIFIKFCFNILRKPVEKNWIFTKIWPQQ